MSPIVSGEFGPRERSGAGAAARSRAAPCSASCSEFCPGAEPCSRRFASYALEKRLSSTPERFGHGAVEGLAGPESANNAAATAAFIPLLTLGIPPNAILGILLGALMIHGIAPGPLLMANNPDVFWGVVASMYIGNVMLLVLNLPLIGMWVQLLRVPYGILFPLILVFCIIGVYGTTGSTFHLGLMIAFGVLGYLLRKTGHDLAPMILGFVLGPLLEANVRRSLIASDGDWSFLLTRPVGTLCLLLALGLVVAALLPAIRSRRLALAGQE